MRCKRAIELLATAAADMPTAKVCVTLPNNVSASVPLSSVLFGCTACAVAQLEFLEVSDDLAYHLFKFVNGRPAPLEWSLNALSLMPCPSLKPCQACCDPILHHIALLRRNCPMPCVVRRQHHREEHHGFSEIAWKLVPRIRKLS